MVPRLRETTEQFLKIAEDDPLGALDLLPPDHILARQFKREAGGEMDLADKVWKGYLKGKFENLRPMLVEGFAAVREVVRRTLNLRNPDNPDRNLLRFSMSKCWVESYSLREMLLK